MRAGVKDADRKGRAVHGLKLSLLLLIVSIIVLGFMVAVGADFNYVQIRALFSRLSISLVSILLLLSIFNFILRSLRWHWFSRRLGFSIPFYVSN